MKKLDPVKVAWIIKQKEKGEHNDAVACTMKVSVRWVQALWYRYRKSGTMTFSEQNLPASMIKA